MTFIGNDLARKYIRKLPKRNKQSWSSLYPKANPVALNLLGKMLVFNPEKRYTVKQSLKHPYFEGLHNEEAEPECEEPFDWTWDDFEPTKDMLQRMVYDESMEFHAGEEDEEV
jgi:mitogen-activated protein kinase 1/3